MIELRRRIDRWKRHPIIGPLIIILLVLVLAIIAIHESHENIAGTAGELCIGIALLLIALVAPLIHRLVRATPSIGRCDRAPPRDRSQLVPRYRSTSVPIPLRL